MRMRTLIVLAVVAAVLVVLAVRTSDRTHTTTPAQIGKLLFPDLPVNDIVRIAITSGSNTTRVEKINDAWVAPARYGYPVRFEKVKESIMMLSELKIREELRINDAQKKALRIIPPGPASGLESGTMVELFAGGDRKVASLLLGDVYERPDMGNSVGGSFADGHYVSTDNGKTVYQVSRALNNLEVGIQDWLNSEILSVDTFSITNFTIQTTNAAPVEIRRNEKNELVIDSLAKDEELDVNIINGLQYALSYFRFDDIADPAITDEEAGMKDPEIFRAITKNGETYTIKMGAKKSGTDFRYVRCEVNIQEEQPPVMLPPLPDPAMTNTPDAKAAAMTPDEAKKKEEIGKAREKVRNLQNTVCKWTYLVQNAKLESLRTPKERLVTKKVEAKPVDKAEGAAAE